MKHSIRQQFALIFIGLMAGTILLCWLINNLFLEQYYIRMRSKVILDAYETISQAANSDTYSTEEFSTNLDEVCNIYNIAACVIDSNSQTQFVSLNGGRELERKLIGYLFGFGSNEQATTIMQENEYVLRKTKGAEGDYLEMFGRLSSGISFVMRSPIESIRESVDIANRFWGYAGLIAALAGGVFIWFVSAKITNPILELNHISEQMLHLDFDTKYTGNSRNEIGLLGGNINKLSQSLERAISELKTANNELQNDIKEKEQIDEMRKEFLANVSHELKTPIALIQGYAEGLMEGVNDDQESRNYYCEVIADEALKMNAMVQKLLTLNQLESGNDTVLLERLDITLLARNYIQSAEILTKQNDITVWMEDYAPVYAWADEYKIEEVFMNYFTNAVNHCSGEKKIIVSMENRGDKVRVGIFNTGEPVPEQALEHLWEKFYKVDKARTREYGGSGVGLSIVKAIMESINQNYGVENYDNGVLFWFELEKCEKMV